MLIRFTKTLKALSFAAATALSAGCASDVIDTDENVGGSAQELGIGAFEAQMICQLINSASTDLSRLDHDAALNARAAKSILAHRNGDDGVYPSADDNTVDSLEELEAIKYVGPTAILALRDYVVANPPASPELVEGVEFSSAQAEAVVWGVNRASVTELDETVGLTNRAADNLVELAPFSSVSEIGNVAYVGPSALQALRDRATTWRAEMDASGPSQAGSYDGVQFDDATAQTALAIAQTATYDQLRSNGVWSGGATRIVEGRPYATLADVAATYGIGRSTMQALKEYAASGSFSE